MAGPRRPRFAVGNDRLNVGPYWLRARSRDGGRYLPARSPVAPTPDPGPDPEPEPEPEEAGMWRTAINVKDEAYGALGDGSTDDRAAINLAIAAARASGLPIYFPAGRYVVEFAKGQTHADGRLLIDWDYAEIFGDGPGLSIIQARGPSAAKGRRASMVDATVPRGRVGTYSTVTGLVLATPSDANNFRFGDYIYFSPNADGSNPRLPSSGLYPQTTAGTPNPNTGAIGIANGAFLTTVVPGDYVFIRYKVFFQNAGEYLNWTAGMGVTISPNADGSSPRATANNNPPKCLSTDAVQNAATFEFNNSVTGFVDGDYLFAEPNYAVFYAPIDSLDSPKSLRIHDLTIEAQYHGFDSGDSTADIYTIVFYQPVAGFTGTTDEYNLYVDNVHVEGGYLMFNLPNSSSLANCPAKWWFRGCDFSGAAGQISMYTNESNLECEFRLYDSYLHDTDFSHTCYLHPSVSIWADSNRFDNVGINASGSSGSAIDHWGLYVTPKHVSITNNWFGPGVHASAILTAPHGYAYIAGNVFSNGVGIAVRCSATIEGNTFRPESTEDTPRGITDFFACAHNSQIKVIGNTFDTGALPERPGEPSPALFTGIVVGFPTKWVIKDNTFTCAKPADSNYAVGDNGPIPNVASIRCLDVSSSAYQNALAADIDFSANNMLFDQSGSSEAALAVFVQSLVDLRCDDNRYVGRGGGTNYGVIYTAPGVLAGTTGKWRFRGNRITAAVGAAFRFDTRFGTGQTLNCEVYRNDVTTVHSTGDGVRVAPSASDVGAATFDVTNNRFAIPHASAFAVVSTANLTAGSLYGESNRGAQKVSATTTAQRLLPSRGTSPSIAVATSITLSGDYDTFPITGTGTLDTALWNGATAAQLAMDGRITLVFAAASAVTIGSGGNFTAAGGARTAGTAAMFQWNATLGKWIES